MKFRVHSLRIEKTMTYNDRDGEYEDNKIYILNCISDCNKKIWSQIMDDLWRLL